MSKLQWQELETFRFKDVALQVSHANVRGRTVYSFRMGKLREDNSIAPFVPVEFHMDDGVVRTGPVVGPIAHLFVQAGGSIQAHAEAADRERAAKLHERDTERMQRQEERNKTSVGTGLSRFTTNDKPKKTRDEAGKRQKDQATRNAMRGKKS